MQKLIIIIEDLIKSYKTLSGGHFYTKRTQLELSYPDESGIKITTFEETTHWDMDSPIETEQNMILTNTILHTQIDLIEPHWKLEQSKLNHPSTRWTTDKGDWIQIHLSDHHIHIITFYSGQY